MTSVEHDSPKLRTFELLRLAAALFVVSAHLDSVFAREALIPLGRWHSLVLPGSAGVEFFFVLSGFVMAVSHRADLAHGGNVGRFLWKRCCRIYPLFWIVLGLIVYRFWGAAVVTDQAIVSWASLLPIRSDNLLVVAWTLRQEMTFYIVLSACLIPRIGRFVLGAWVLATVVWWFVLPASARPDFVLSAHLFSLFNFEFFAGLLAGWLLPRWPQHKLSGWITLAAGAAVVGWRMSLDGWGAEYGPVYARLVYGVGYAAILLAFALLERGGVIHFGRRTATMMSVAGALSYPLYLSHLWTFGAVADLIGPAGIAVRLGPDATFAALVTATLAFAALLAFLVDRPLQRILRRLSFIRTVVRSPLGMT